VNHTVAGDDTGDVETITRPNTLDGCAEGNVRRAGFGAAIHRTECSSQQHTPYDYSNLVHQFITPIHLVFDIEWRTPSLVRKPVMYNWLPERSPSRLTFEYNGLSGVD
jgi:hypothetical protein